MLGKLMKYEFKATGRVFLPLFAALIVISAVNRLLSVIGLRTPFTIGAVVSGMLIAGIFVIVIILTIQRFRQNLLLNEGHLMMTLPVSTDNLILSKLFTASIWSVASFLVAVLSIFIMASSGINFSDAAAFFSALGEELSGQAVETVLVTFESLVFIALTVFSSVLTLYTCIAMSMLVNKRRGLFAFGMYIAISTIMQILASVIAAIAVVAEIDSNWLERTFSNFSTFGQTQIVFAAVLLGLVIICAAFYALTRYMLKNRLNLQ